MKVSLNTIKQFTKVDLPVDELVQKINQQLGGVEGITNLGERYEGAVIAKVIKCEKHPNADKLSLCEIDAGTGENVQVVCGAPNVREGLWVVWLKPGATVPSTFEDKQPFVLEARELRGLMSNGMLASAKELALGDDHNGIVEINPDEWRPYDTVIKPGASFAECFGLNDTIIDIENKMFTHRPDLFGHIGVAREISAILRGVTSVDEGTVDTRFENPEWYWSLPEMVSGEGLELQVENKASDVVPRFMAVAMKNVEVKPSPLWLQCALVAMGSKAINNIVDVTNYVMLLTAQPTHAYDYDKLRGKYLGTRMANPGEEVLLLNGKKYTLDENDIVIVDGEGPVGLGGIMGGGNSEVSADTKNIVLEVANFDMYTVRKMSMKYGLFTDALTRFNKGQSPLQNSRVLALLMASVKDVCDAAQASPVFDLPENAWVNKDSLSGEIRITTEFINSRLGINLTVHQIGNILRSANFASYSDEKDEDTLLITAPFWRTDIVDPEDVVEEVGRLYGFDKLPRELPLRSTKPAPKNPTRETKQKIRESLARSGANEVLTYSFVHEKVLAGAGQDVAKAFKLSNALSPDLQYYRLSVLPSLLDKVHMNIKAGHNEFTLFEIGKAHHKDYFDDEKAPIEISRIAGVYANKASAKNASFYKVKAVFTQLVADFGLHDVTFQPLKEFDYGQHDVLRQLAAPFDENRSAMVWVDDKFGGVVGELKPAVLHNFKLPENTAAFELFASLLEKAPQRSEYTPLSRFPSISQDISLRVASSVSYADIFETAKNAAVEAASEIDVSISPVSIYQPENDDSHKTITLRVKLTHHERTLKEKDASAVIEAIASRASESFSASVA